MVSVAHIKELYTEFNAKFFNNELPSADSIRFAVMSLSPVGQAWDRRSVGRGIWLRISSRYDLTEPQLRNTVCHEMVHIWQYVTDRRDHHGYWFKRKAAEIRAIDGGMIIERVYNPANEGKLVVKSDGVKSVIVSWFVDGRWRVGRVSEGCVNKYGWLMRRYKDCGIAMYEAVGGELLAGMPKCRSRIIAWPMSEENYMERVFPYLVREIA